MPCFTPGVLAALAPQTDTDGAAPWRWRPDVEQAGLPATPDLSASARRVLAACLITFSDRGFGATSVRDIAEVAGVQAPSLYKQFPSKTAMLDKLALVGHESHIRRLTDAVLEAGASPTEQLRALAREHVALHCEYPRLGRVLTAELAHLSPMALSVVLALREQGNALTRQVLERGVTSGEFEVSHPGLTQAAIGSLGVAASGWFPYQSQYTAAEVADEFTTLILRMVGAADTRGQT